MTIEGAIAQLQELIDNDGIPFWAKPSLQKVMETVEMEREQHIDERKTGKWIDHSEDGYVECPLCSHLTTCEGNKEDLHYCFWCGAKMEGDEISAMERMLAMRLKLEQKRLQRRLRRQRQREEANG